MKPFVLVARGAVILVFAAKFAASDAVASHPDILRDYQFIPSHSTLVVNGASSAFEETFHTFGTFGLVTGYEDGVTCTAIGCPPPPNHIPAAWFVGVDAWLVPDSPLAYVLNLDETLNLSGLDGTFTHTDPNHLFFAGEDGRGRPFHLEARIHDRLIHLVGESGPGCCNVSHYKFDALAYLMPYPDYNLDGVVDAADYIMGRKTAAESGLDFDAELWRAHFGEAIDFSEFTNDDFNSSAVPEPTTIALLIVSILLLRQRRLVRWS